MVQQGSKIWRDGNLIDVGQGGASVPLLTHTLHYGVGAFEGIRAYRRQNGESAIFRLEEHITRLYNSCKLALIPPNCSFSDVCDGCVAVLRDNGMREGYIRPMVLLGDGAMGLLPSGNPTWTIITAWAWGAYLGAEGVEKGIRCKISSYSRHPLNSSFAQAKLTGQYITSVMAKQEAKLAGYDEAILLDTNGFVAEGSGENIFVVRQGRMITPPISASILPGITRDTIMTLAREEGLSVTEERFGREELFLAEEVFLTGTAAEVTPVREVDNRTVGTGSVGPVTQRLQQRYFDTVRGGDDSHPEWFTRF